MHRVTSGATVPRRGIVGTVRVGRTEADRAAGHEAVRGGGARAGNKPAPSGPHVSAAPADAPLTFAHDLQRAPTEAPRARPSSSPRRVQCTPVDPGPRPVHAAQLPPYLLQIRVGAPPRKPVGSPHTATRTVTAAPSPVLGGGWRLGEVPCSGAGSGAVGCTALHRSSKHSWVAAGTHRTRSGTRRGVRRECRGGGRAGGEGGGARARHAAGTYRASGAPTR